MTNSINLPGLPRNEVANLLNSDEAFKYSVENKDIGNMQIVLRAHGYDFSYQMAEHAVWFGEQEMVAPGFNNITN